MNTTKILKLCEKIDVLRVEQNVYLRTIGEGLLSKETVIIFYDKVDKLYSKIESFEASIKRLVSY